MLMSHSIKEILALAAETSPVDDKALELLGRRLLSAVLLDPETPETLKQAVGRMLLNSENVQSAADVGTPEEPPD